MVAHLWRRITAARGLDGSTTTSVCIAVDGRARMSPPVPDGYTGNVVLWARPAAAARDLVARPLRHAVELIDREVARVDGAYFGDGSIDAYVPLFSRHIDNFKNLCYSMSLN